MAGTFATLRDQYQINLIKMDELKRVAKLGEGAYAVVERCIYTPADGSHAPMTVAVKKLKPSLMENKGDVQSFLSEVSLMRKLKHEGIVGYVGLGYYDVAPEGSNKGGAAKVESIFLVSEFVAGGTIKATVMKQLREPHSNVYTLPVALRWCIDIAAALAYIHKAKPLVIHRDLKLENILITSTSGPDSRAKLADFGLVALVHQRWNKQRAQSLNRSSDASSSAETTDRWNVEAIRSIKRMNSHKSLAVAFSLPTPSEPSVSAPGTSEAIRDTPRNLSAVVEGIPSAPPPHSSLPLAVHRISIDDLRASRATTCCKDAASQPHLSGKTGTLMYMAPEMYRSEHYNEKVDVFSFAVIMYELLHKYMMVFAITNKGTEQEIEAYASKVSDGYRPPMNNNLPASIQAIINDAWSQDPSDRPAMAVLLTRLQEVEKSGVMDAFEKETNAGCCSVC